MPSFVVRSIRHLTELGTKSEHNVCFSFATRVCRSCSPVDRTDVCYNGLNMAGLWEKWVPTVDKVRYAQRALHVHNLK